MNIIIIEDENIAARRLERLLLEIDNNINVLAHLNSVENATQWLKANTAPDLIFLDIQLNDGYGFEIFDADIPHPPIIFTTAYNEYAIKGFKYNSIDYLLKPIEKEDLIKALKKHQKQQNTSSIDGSIENFKKLLSKDYKKRFIVKVGNQLNTFKTDEIAYFKSEDGMIFLITHQHKKYPIDYSIEQLESILDPFLFFRINRKFLVSVDSVKEIHTYFNSRLLLKTSPEDTDQMIVARERASNFKKWLDS